MADCQSWKWKNEPQEHRGGDYENINNIKSQMAKTKLKCRHFEIFSEGIRGGTGRGVERGKTPPQDKVTTVAV